MVNINTKKISNLSFMIGLGLGSYALYRLVYNYFTLPKGVCPLNSGIPYALAALVFIGVSVLLDLKKDTKKTE